MTIQPNHPTDYRMVKLIDGTLLVGTISVDEQFFIDDTLGGLTTVSRLGSSFKSMAQELLNHYAR